MLPLLQHRYNERHNEVTPLVLNIRQAEQAVKGEKDSLAELDEAIKAPFDSSLGLETKAGLQWRQYLGTGGPFIDFAPKDDTPKDRRIRKRKDGTRLAVVNPREVTPEQAGHMPSAQPLWGHQRASGQCRVTRPHSW